MKRNEIYTHEDQIYRILIVKEDNCLVIDCKNNSMPVWKPVTTFWDASTMTDEDLYTLLDFKPVEDDMVSPERKKVMHERYTMIAPVLSFIGDENTRSHVINIIATENNISKQSTINNIDTYAEPIESTIQILVPDENGNFSYRYELPKGASESGTYNVKVMFPDGKPGMYDQFGWSASENGLEDLIIETYTLNEDCTVTFAIYVPKSYSE